jgi:hypothetical protein
VDPRRRPNQAPVHHRPGAARAADAVERYDLALDGFASPPPAWFLFMDRLGHWSLLPWIAVSGAVCAMLMGSPPSGAFFGIVPGLILAAAAGAAATSLAKRRAQAASAMTPEAIVESLGAAVRRSPGNDDWIAAILTDDPASAHRVHDIAWRIAGSDEEDGITADDELY